MASGLDYSALQQRIIDESDRDNIAARVQSFIAEAETEMWQDLRLRVMQRRFINKTSDSKYINLPDRYLEMYRLTIEDNGRKKRLWPASSAEIIDNRADQGIPDYFSVYGTYIEFERTPPSGLEIEMVFYQAPYPLGYQATSLELGTTPPKILPQHLDENNRVISNAILDNFAHLYIWRSMVAVATWAKDDASLERYSSLYASGVAKSNRNAKDGRVTGGPLRTFNKVGSP